MGGTTTGAPNLAGLAPPPTESTMSYLGQSSSLMDFIGRFINRKQFQQQQSLQKAFSLIEMDNTLSPLGGAGIIDHDAITKLLKKSGIPFTTDPQKLASAAKAQALDAGGQETQTGPAGADPLTGGVLGVPPGGGPGAAPMQAPQGAPPYVQRAVDMYNRIKASGKPADPLDLLRMKMDVLAGRAIQIQTAKEKDELAKAEVSQRISNLRQQVLGDDPVAAARARGKLIADNDISLPSMEQQMWDGYSDQEKQEARNVALGHESQAQKDIRKQQGQMSLFMSGALNMNDAGELMDDVVNGRKIPGELMAKLRPTDASVEKTLGIVGAAQAMGLQGDELTGFVQAVQSGADWTHMWPKSLQSMAQQKVSLEMEVAKATLALRQRQLADEAAKNGKNIDALAQKDIDTYDRAALHPKDFDPAYLKQLQERAAKATGMTVEQYQTWWEKHMPGWLGGGGTESRLVQQVSPEDQKKIDELSGKKSAGTPDDSITKRVGTTLKKMFGPPQPGEEPAITWGPNAPKWLPGRRHAEAQPSPTAKAVGTVARPVVPGGKPSPNIVKKGAVTVKFGSTKDTWVDFAPDDIVGPDGETVDELRAKGWTDDAIAESIKQRNVRSATSPAR